MARDEVRRRLIVATCVPLVSALAVASWLVWVRSDPARSGGFCANATAEFAVILEESAADQNGGAGLTPDVPAILEAARSVDVERLEVNAPAAIEGDLDVLAAALPDLAKSEAGAEVAPEVQAALARVLAAYLERCR